MCTLYGKCDLSRDGDTVTDAPVVKMIGRHVGSDKFRCPSAISDMSKLQEAYVVIRCSVYIFSGVINYPGDLSAHAR